MSPRRPSDKPARVVDAAMTLVHEQGFHRTTLADISEASGVPLGNLSYYFKTKEAIAAAIIEQLTRAYDSRRAAWEAEADPRVRIQAFIQMTVDNREALARSGCPVGTLCAELHKQGGGAIAERASAVFATLLEWLEVQFRLMGRGEESRDLAAHLLAALQGASLLAHAFHESALLEREAERLRRWVAALAARPHPEEEAGKPVRG